jgi:hypothetical protein
MKALLWIYAVIGTFYAAMYCCGVEVVVRYADGLLGLLMFTAPLALAFLFVRDFIWS